MRSRHPLSDLAASCSHSPSSKQSFPCSWACALHPEHLWRCGCILIYAWEVTHITSDVFPLLLALKSLVAPSGHSLLVFLNFLFPLVGVEDWKLLAVPLIGLTDLANKNIGHPIKCEFQINNVVALLV